MKNYDDNLEKYLTAIFGGIGILAVIVNLYLKEYETTNILDAVKDISGLVVVIAVFLVANRMFQKDKKVDFVEEFEIYLKEWIQENDYLICDDLAGDGKGKYQKRFCSMVIDHSNLVTRKKTAKAATPNKEKGSFVYLPYLDESGNYKNEFEFRFNERTFERQTIYRNEKDEVDLKAILAQIALRIEDSYKHLNIETKVVASNKTIIVSYDNMEKSKENARKLIDLVEFVKTLVLAIA